MKKQTLFIKAALSLTLAMLSVSCTVLNPTTGRKQISAFSQEEEIQIGSKTQVDFIKQNGGHIPSKQIQDYVTKLGHQLAAASLRADLPWEFHTLNTNSLNAFALPGGKVFITRGLLSKLTSKAQLAGVLGHEVGHVTAKHFNDKYAKQVGIGLISAGISIYGKQTENQDIQKAGAIAPAILTTLTMQYDRNQEHESDKLGLRYMSKIGLNPEGQLHVMEVLKAASNNNSLEIFSTHPLPETRIQALKGILRQDYPGYNDDKTYNRGVDSYTQNVLNILKKLPPPTPASKPQTK